MQDTKHHPDNVVPKLKVLERRLKEEEKEVGSIVKVWSKLKRRPSPNCKTGEKDKITQQRKTVNVKEGSVWQDTPQGKVTLTVSYVWSLMGGVRIRVELR